MNAVTQQILLAAPTFDPGADGQTLLDILAWCATAAGVLGIIITGIILALQVFSGQFGAGEMYFKQFGYVIVASMLAATAGPLVGFLNLF